eukprot:scaffold3849_cov264-Ochromonas_danica.AAC.4
MNQPPPSPSPFYGNNLEQWVEHFRLSEMVLMILVNDYEARSVEDLIDWVFDDGRLLNQFKECISEEDCVKLDVAIPLTHPYPPPPPPSSQSLSSPPPPPPPSQSLSSPPPPPSSQSPPPPTSRPHSPTAAIEAKEEDGREGEIVDLALLFDCSYLMVHHFNRLQLGLAGLTAFFENTSNVNLRIAIIGYDHNNVHGENFDNGDHIIHLNNLAELAGNNVIDEGLYQPDLLVGLWAAYTLNWTNARKVLYHLAPFPMISGFDVNVIEGLNGLGVMMSSGHIVEGLYQDVGNIAVDDRGLVNVASLMDSISEAVRDSFLLPLPL